MPKHASPSILIVDDDPVSVQLMGAALMPDYSCEFALSAARALERLTTGTPPALILLDLVMPEMDGHTLLRLLDDDPRLKDIPVICVTAKQDPESETRALEAGAADFIGKPINPPVLRLRVGLQLKLRQREQELRDSEARFEHLAHYDALTALPNRLLLGDRLHQSMVQTQRRQRYLALAYLDLDGFKTINDSHGHAAGDQLLIALSDRMRQALRAGDTLARLGGDEFVAVLIDLKDNNAGVPVLDRLLAAVAAPVTLGDQIVQVSTSIGVAFYPQLDEVDADQLLRRADQAMYQAKLTGKNRYHVFSSAYDRDARGRHDLRERIRHALAGHEFLLYYQPKVNLRTGTVISVEALIRWQHPEHGLLTPLQFLPMIENDPLAVNLGEWVIETALTQMEDWQATGLDLPVSVNVSAWQLQQANFVERLRALLARHPEITPSRLILEVSEATALKDLARVSQVIADCRAIGVSVILGDCGAGDLSLNALKRLAVTLLNIDRSFVDDMLENPDDLAIVERVLSLSRALHRQVAATGMETRKQGEMLLQLGCELAQGYGITRPLPTHAVTNWLADWRSSPRWTDLPLASTE